MAEIGKKYEALVPNIDRPRCIDGSLDMRYSVNKGLNKYGYYPVKREGPTAKELQDKIEKVIAQLI